MCYFHLQLEQSVKGEEVVSKEIMAMSEEEIENEIKEVRLLCLLTPTLQNSGSRDNMTSSYSLKIATVNIQITISFVVSNSRLTNTSVICQV